MERRRRRRARRPVPRLRDLRERQSGAGRGRLRLPGGGLLHLHRAARLHGALSVPRARRPRALRGGAADLHGRDGLHEPQHEQPAVVPPGPRRICSPRSMTRPRARATSSGSTPTAPASDRADRGRGGAAARADRGRRRRRRRDFANFGASDAGSAGPPPARLRVRSGPPAPGPPGPGRRR